MKSQTVLSILCVCISLSCAADWPTWRGPAYNGTSPETNLPDTLDPASASWSIDLPGPSSATPVIVGSRLYLSSTEKDSDNLLAMGLDAASGKVLWNQAVTQKSENWPQNNQASSSPNADASGAYFFYGDGTLVKLSPAGEELWRRNLVSDYGPMAIKFGYSATPLLHEGRVYVPMLRRQKAYRDRDYTGSLESYVLCMDGKSGKTLWKVDRPSDAVDESTNAYNTPIYAEIDGKEQVLIYGGDFLTGHDLESGRELWRYDYSVKKEDYQRLIPTPVTDGERIYCPYPRGTRTMAFDLKKLAKGETPTLWVHDVTGPDVSSPVVYKGFLYQFDDSKKRTMTCLNPLSGQEQWTAQLEKGALYYASITAADDKLYFINDEGDGYVVAADPKELRVLSRFKIDEKPVHASIAVAGGRMYLRTPSKLYCFEGE